MSSPLPLLLPSLAKALRVASAPSTSFPSCAYPLGKWTGGGAREGSDRYLLYPSHSPLMRALVDDDNNDNRRNEHEGESRR
ncbi:hypothetical protein OPV22_003217 [Ensete ventricosum]|uniref:Secreted protein n=1 Tax=Ensete ventricosum TaxID=4639 RepID=A0AAV8S078_ENSVE|nr:hypothetical protein OPV22_003217 [Ensete ventricosum]